jgi:hypothetical protein
MPTEDNVFIKMNPVLYSIKICFFIFLYVFSDADIWNTDDLEYQKAKNIKIIRSTWVLYVPRLFLIGVIIQIVFLFYSFGEAWLFEGAERQFDSEREYDDVDEKTEPIVLANIIVETQEPVPVPIPVPSSHLPKEEIRDERPRSVIIPSHESESYSQTASTQSGQRRKKKNPQSETKKEQDIRNEKDAEQLLKHIGIGFQHRDESHKTN